MPTDYGQCDHGNVYGDSPPDIPRGKPEDIHDVLDKHEPVYGFDWPGIGPPPRRYVDQPPSVRAKTRRAVNRRGRR